MTPEVWLSFWLSWLTWWLPPPRVQARVVFIAEWRDRRRSLQQDGR
jgi:hypothetical protein